MWRPDFPHVEARRALLRGYHRALCVYSIRYRGTPECPGLVLGLERGGPCLGRAFRVATETADAVTAYLDGRELVTGVYAPKFVNVRPEGGRRAAAGLVRWGPSPARLGSGRPGGAASGCAGDGPPPTPGRCRY